MRTCAVLLTALHWLPNQYFLTRMAMDPSVKKVTVLLVEQEFERLESYCQSRGHKKSTLIARLIREHLEREKFEPNQLEPLLPKFKK